MKELIVATGNKGKLKEFSLLLHARVARVWSLADFPQCPDIIENGKTFTENALIKARSAALATGIPAIADDSGLVVDALHGLPGVRSARYAGENACDEDNTAKLLKELASVPAERRTAAFVSVIALCYPDGECVTFEGELKGIILGGPRGTGGFGYDPLFIVPEFGQTLAELPLETKNVISHRGRAFCRFLEYLQGT
jgi:XTP/dITP diphosphohydrolase